MQMNRRELMLSVIASALTTSLSQDILAEETLDQDATSSASLSRPRLYLNTRSMQGLSARYRDDQQWAESLRKKGEALLAADFIPETVAEEGGGQQAKYILPARQISEMGMTLGLLYRLTRDERYAKKLHEGMVYYGKYVRWGGPGLADRVPPWHSELDTSEFCMGYACGYDVLHEYLSPAQRAQVSSDLIRLGILPTLDDWILPPRRFHSLDSMGHNWWGVCVSGAGIAALSLLGDEPRAQEWIDHVDAGFVEWFSYGGNALHNRIETFEKDGPSYEGVGYTGYGVSNYLRYLLAWKNVFPGRKHPAEHFVKGIAEFCLHTQYPASARNLVVNFEDCTETVDVTEMGLLLLACGVEDDYAYAFVENAHGPLGDTFPFYRPKQRPTAALPLSKVYPRMGWAMMRNSWEKDATFLAVKSGYTWNHAHADASTFLLMHRGSPLIIDSGTCPYGRPEYSTYYRQSLAHNVVLFDGQGQPTDQITWGVKFRGSILRWSDGLGVRYVAADATGPMSQLLTRHYRHFLWFGNIILIFDDLEAFRDGQMEWLLHTAGETRNLGTGRLALQNKNASAEFAMLYPSTQMEVRQGLVEEHPDQQIPYHAFLAATKDRYQRFISAIHLEPSSSFPVEVREHAQYLEARVQQEGQSYLVYFNLRSIEGAYNMSSTIGIGDWTTDAYMVVFAVGEGNMAATPEKAKLFQVVDGSFLRWRGTSVFESLSKGDCMWNQGSPMEIFSQGQKNLSYSVYAQTEPEKVLWNGSEVQPVYDASRKLFTLRSYALHG